MVSKMFAGCIVLFEINFKQFEIMVKNLKLILHNKSLIFIFFYNKWGIKLAD